MSHVTCVSEVESGGVGCSVSLLVWGRVVCHMLSHVTCVSVVECGGVGCNVSQCVAGRCSVCVWGDVWRSMLSHLTCVSVMGVVEWVAVCRSKLQGVAVGGASRASPPACVRDPVVECVAVCCSVLQCVAVCCSVLQYAAVCCRVLRIESKPTCVRL